MTAIWAPQTDIWATDPATWPNSITRTYRGDSTYVTSMMQSEANRFAQVGYTLTSQAYVPGDWGCLPFAAGAFLILFFGVGLLVLIYLVAVKPDGIMTAVFLRR